MPDMRLLSSAVISFADVWAPVRLSTDFRPMNTMAALDEFVKPFTDKPGNCTAESVPGTLSAIFPIW